MLRRSQPRQRRANRARPEVASLEGRSLLSADVLTYHNDNARDGTTSQETALTPHDVNTATFGKVGFFAVDGKVDAQPLYKAGVAIRGRGVHDVLFVATERDSVYAFDAHTGATLWHASVLGRGETPSDPRGGGQVIPVIGITATPVIDPAHGTIDVVAMSKRVAGGRATYFQRLHALDLATGRDQVAPAAIDAAITYPGRGPGGNGSVVAFDPKQYKERDALLLLNGVVYTSWSSHSDQAPYTGWIIGFDARTLRVASVLNINPNGTPRTSVNGDGSGNSFWNSGDGPAADAAGNLYNLSANGPFDPAVGDYGDAFIKAATAGGLRVVDYFAPANQQAEADVDEDLGSSGIVLTDVRGGNGIIRHLAIGSGKDGNIYVVDRDNLGQFHRGGDAIYQEIPNGVGGGEFSAPAAFNGQVYFGGVGDNLRAYRFTNGILGRAPASRSGNTFAYPGTSPAISANGATGGIAWAMNNGGDGAVLYAYDAADLGRQLYGSDQAANGRDRFGVGNKFITPMIADGRVYVGTTNGVAVFGLRGLTVATPAAITSGSVTGTTVRLGALGADPAYHQWHLTYTWAATSLPRGAAPPTFVANGTAAAGATTATFRGAGTYTLRVTIANPAGQSTTSSLNVTIPGTPAPARRKR